MSLANVDTVILLEGGSPGPASQEGAARGRIVIEPDKCQGCRSCEMACSLKNAGVNNPSRARISVARSLADNILASVPVVCQQCAEPLCMLMCPAGALSRDPVTDAVVVDPDKCLGCRICSEVCPFGAPAVDRRTGVCDKCTLCDGDPMCVKTCSNDALKFVDADEEGVTRRRDTMSIFLEQLRRAHLPVEGSDS